MIFRDVLMESLIREIYILFSISTIYDIIYQIIFISIFTNTIREKMDFHSFYFYPFLSENILFIYEIINL